MNAALASLPGVYANVVEKMADSIRVKGTHEFSRLDFGVGKEPDGTNEKVAKNVKVEMQLTLKKS